MSIDGDIAIIATDGTGAVTRWNRAAQRVYGWTEAQALGRRILDLTPSTQSRAEAEAIMAALLRGEPWEGEIVLKRMDGQPFRAYVRNFPLGDLTSVQGGIIGFSAPAERRALLDEHRAGIEIEVARWAAETASN